LKLLLPPTSQPDISLASRRFCPDKEDGVVEVEGGAISAFKTFWLSG